MTAQGNCGKFNTRDQTRARKKIKGKSGLKNGRGMEMWDKRHKCERGNGWWKQPGAEAAKGD